MVLDRVNLYYSSMERAKLAGTQLIFVNLSRAALLEADLRRAVLDNANLYWASLESAKFNGASLRYSCAYTASLMGADLRGVDFTGSTLKHADIRDALFDENTTLPDGSNWSTKTVMSQFTGYQ